MKELTIEQKYKSLSEVEHVLLRPGTYVGSTVLCEPTTEWVFDEESNKFVEKDVKYVPALLKLFDEIFSNSIDESKRNKKLDTIKVDIDQEKGIISVYDNGGIPVVVHKLTNMYVCELIFGTLRSGSNFNDDEQRDWVGTNGLGSTLTNIFSKKFVVKSADGKNEFLQTYENNMSKKSKPKIKPSTKKFTEITFEPDLERFGIKKIDKDHYDMFVKRVITAAATSPNLKIYINGTRLQFKTFESYCKMFSDDVIFEKGRGWEIGFSSSSSFRHMSIVNSAETKDGGTHVNYITDQVVNYLRERIKKKHKIDLKPGDIKNHLFVFISCSVNNPAYSSQTKEKLITDPRNFGTSHTITEKTLKAIFNSEITQNILDWVSKKTEADERAAVRNANKQLAKVKINKLVDAKGKDRSKCTLMLCEGDSPMAGFRKYRDPETQGAFPLRGKSLNVREVSESKAIQNQEIKNIVGALGLQFGKSPFVYDKNGKLVEDNLRYGKVLIYSDADVDGIACASLLVNLFERWWPELFKEHRIARCETPVIIAQHKKSKKKLNFYYDDEWVEWQNKNNVNDYDIDYKKGLAALSDEEYSDIIKNPRLYYYELTDKSNEKLNVWFGNESTLRKDELMNPDIPDRIYKDDSAKNKELKKEETKKVVKKETKTKESKDNKSKAKKKALF